MDLKVKGSILISWVRIIRANKSGLYDNYLTDKDRETISEKILPNLWYPLETYKHCVMAVFEVIAKKDLEVATEWGRTFAKEVMAGVYGALMEELTPLDYIKKINVIHRTLFNFGKIEPVLEGEKQALIKLSDFDPQFIPLQYINKGWVEGSLSLCGAENIKIEIVTKSWEGKPYTSMRYSWT